MVEYYQAQELSYLAGAQVRGLDNTVDRQVQGLSRVQNGLVPELGFAINHQVQELSCSVSD